MDRTELLAAIADARPGPFDVVYVERRGADYNCRVTGPEEDLLLGGGAAEFPDVWIYWSGDWPAEDPERQRDVFDDLLAEMETMITGGDRCRWSPEEPWPRQH
jgi:hypothetical protein